ncbi:hypothetical protein L226DRAFT_399601 [Lentinus tigrinus ALCF2SS1-7]|uniref:Uncharacterized protein n=1 Tax=Lentinus tigrinus ALCF2SS1-6 TaxID=1328759 RepID=A0A5C2SCR2_9APHY|nr:hypothetical protein L227DRAFT_652332 [Lentinus tigrinus ALCF2SS1-6]RPD76174.1 hypothetical protein L226DRAFT_399601 [Lentinus tigrinus ALCF2SS1-7]
MQRCVELSRVPKSHGVRGIQFKRTTPGSIGHIWNANKPPPKHRVLDPSHPALDYTPSQFAKAFPWRACPGFAIRAIPKGLLEKPPIVFPDPPFTFTPVRSADAKDGRHGNGRVNMSLMTIAQKSTGSRVLRVNVTNKLKTAVSLVVMRGADVEKNKDGQERIVFGEERTGDSWVLSDWTYICRPSLEFNRMPYSALVPPLRSTLRDIVLQGRRFERAWWGRSVTESQKAQQKHAQKRVNRKDTVAVEPVKDAVAEQLINVIETAPAVYDESSEPSYVPAETTTSSPPLSSPSVNSPATAQTDSRPKESAPLHGLDAMLKRMRSRLPASPSRPTPNASPSRLRVDGRASTREPAARVRS